VTAAACNFCGFEVAPGDGSTYQRVMGWERRALEPSRRGGSDIVLREQLQVFACAGCVERLKSGLNVGQEALL
jgi:hypothetical protein